MADRNIHLVRLKKCLEQGKAMRKLTYWSDAVEEYRDWQRNVATSFHCLKETELDTLWTQQTTAPWLKGGLFCSSWIPGDNPWEEWRAKLNGGIALLESVLESIDTAQVLPPQSSAQSTSGIPEHGSFQVTTPSRTVFNIRHFTGVLGNAHNSQVALYDYSSVQQLLVDRQIPKQDRRELEDIMDELNQAPAAKKPSLIKRGEDWNVKHKELLGAAGEAASKAIGVAVKH